VKKKGKEELIKDCHFMTELKERIFPAIEILGRDIASVIMTGLIFRAQLRRGI